MVIHVTLLLKRCTYPNLHIWERFQRSVLHDYFSDEGILTSACHICAMWVIPCLL